jgi:hypothetical protein
MELHLTDTEAKLIRDALDELARELSHEIHHTHSRDFKESLKAKRAVVDGVLAKLHSVDTVVA